MSKTPNDSREGRQKCSKEGKCSVSKNAAPVKTHRSKAKAEATRRGLLYALPDWLMIIMLFFVPIVLLVIMAGSRWSLMGGNRG